MVVLQSGVVRWGRGNHCCLTARRYSGFLPQCKDLEGGFIEESKLPAYIEWMVRVWVNGTCAPPLWPGSRLDNKWMDVLLLALSSIYVFASSNVTNVNWIPAQVLDKVPGQSLGKKYDWIKTRVCSRGRQASPATSNHQPSISRAASLARPPLWARSQTPAVVSTSLVAVVTTALSMAPKPEAKTRQGQWEISSAFLISMTFKIIHAHSQQSLLWGAVCGENYRVEPSTFVFNYLPYFMSSLHMNKRKLAVK